MALSRSPWICIGGKMRGELDDGQDHDRDPERLATDTAFEAVVEKSPIHESPITRRNAARRRQSRSNSLMLVLARVFSSTRLTMTAQ